MACKRLDLHELDLIDLESNLSLDWDMKADQFIDHMISNEILLDQSLELEFIDDLGEFLRATDEDYLKSSSEQQQKKGSNNEGMVWQTGNNDSNLCVGDRMSLSVSFDTILTSIIERMNCNFNACNSGENDTSAQEFVFYVHNVSGWASEQEYEIMMACQSN